MKCQRIQTYPNCLARETETLRLIAKAKTTKEIAAQLHISIKTVEHHREHLYTKLGAHSAVDLVVHAVLYGLVDL